MTTDGVIRSHHLPPTLQVAEAREDTRQGTLPDKLEQIERRLIAEALEDSRGNMAKAARALGITERVMGLRVNRFDLDPKEYKRPR